ncbi:MFS transporter, partial [Streptomyces sp. NPDC048428]|uniref:MFS transporter n=1 Tax=Streptomyces sp. NPDC048428 TaxID=3154503 RepID=UPI00342EDC5B
MTEPSTVEQYPPGLGPTEPPTRNGKLSTFLGLGNVGVYLVWGAVPGVLLGLQLQGIDAAHKEQNLAIVITVGSVVATFAQPLWGMLSDRTRSEFGRRSPFLVGCAVLGAVSLVGMATAGSVLTLAVWWCLVQALVTGVQGTLSAVLPDRVPVTARGTAAAALGFGSMVGLMGGQILASSLGTLSYLVPYGILAGALVTLIVMFVVVNPDRPSTGEPREPFSARVVLGTFWVSPRRHPDFVWAVLARLLLMFGYFMVSGYLFYILQDYVDLGREGALAAVPVMALCALGGMAASIFVTGRLSDRYGRRKPFVAAASALMGLGMFV